MKLLLVSDLHYTTETARLVYGIADPFDLVVIGGDHLDIAAPAALKAQIVVISRYLTRQGSGADRGKMLYLSWPACLKEGGN